jgi:hypothetical protein
MKNNFRLWVNLMQSTQPGIARRRGYFFNAINTFDGKPFVALGTMAHSFWNAIYGLVPYVANWVDIETEYDPDYDYADE